ncbi:MAG: NADH-quinone oxidoreductase subunit I [Planctomycetales bacterium]
MKTDDKAIRWIEEPKLGLAGKMYLTPLIDGLSTTAKHFFSVVKGDSFTRQFPEQRPEFPNPLIYRGVHRLNKDEQGRVQCVACFMCATACPAHCIDIVGAEAPWEDREKYPQSFVIDELRCIFCGMCEEACPCDAIELTTLFDLTGASREEMVFDKEKLLSVYDMTKDKEPMKTTPAGANHPGMQHKTEHKITPPRT